MNEIRIIRRPDALVSERPDVSIRTERHIGVKPDLSAGVHFVDLTLVGRFVDLNGRPRFTLTDESTPTWTPIDRFTDVGVGEAPSFDFSLAANSQYLPFLGLTGI